MGLAALEHGQQLAVSVLSRLQQPRVLVVPVQVLELFEKLRVHEEATGRSRAARLSNRRPSSVGSKRCSANTSLGAGLALEPDEYVVAEQQQVADRHDVARHAVVLGAHALVGDYRQLGSAKHVLALGVERVGLFHQRRTTLGETLTDDLVVAAV